MSRAHRIWRASVHGVLTLMALLSSCAVPDARIDSVSVTRVTERSGVPIALGTTGCTPGFDLDRGLMDADPTASLRFGDDPSGSPAMRTGFEAFTALLPEWVPPGTYPLELVLSDGRHAPFAGHIDVTPLDPSITAVTSPRSTVGVGEAGVPLSVSVWNRSACAVDNLVLTPTFNQFGALQLVVRGPESIHLDPRSVGTFDFTADIGSAVSAGPIQINATATGGTRVGLGACSGHVDAVNDPNGAVWTVVPAANQSIQVTGISQNPPRTVHPGDTFAVDVTVHNRAGVDLTITGIDPRSDPAGVTLPLTPAPVMADVLAGSSATVSVTFLAPTMPSAGTFTLGAIATAHDRMSGATYISPAATSATTTVMIH